MKKKTYVFLISMRINNNKLITSLTCKRESAINATVYLRTTSLSAPPARRSNWSLGAAAGTGTPLTHKMWKLSSALVLQSRGAGGRGSPPISGTLPPPRDY